MPDEQADATIAQICERLDRLPLAIELAAARVSAMSAEEILAGLESRLGELGGGRLAPPQQRTVRATVEWSYGLLDTAEQDALRDLAVFVGGFDAEAGIAVAPGLSLNVLARLVDKSLVSVRERERATQVSAARDGSRVRARAACRGAASWRPPASATSATSPPSPLPGRKAGPRRPRRAS